MSGYRISQLAERTGFSPSTLRYYEQVGLLSTQRTAGGYRSYGEGEVTRLRFIARARQLGLPLDDIRELVTVWGSEPCSSVKTRLDGLLMARSKDVAARISELTAFGAELARARDALAAPSPAGPCDDGCGCTSNQGVPLELGRPRPIGPARLEQRPAAAAEVPIACTLSGDGQRAQAGEWAELLDQATRRTPVDGGVNVIFPADPVLVGRLASLAVREKQCCAFFAFTLDITAAGSVTLQVRAPQAGPAAGSPAAGGLMTTRGGRLAVVGAAGACAACCAAPSGSVMAVTGVLGAAAARVYPVLMMLVLALAVALGWRHHRKTRAIPDQAPVAGLPSVTAGPAAGQDSPHRRIPVAARPAAGQPAHCGGVAAEAGEQR